MKTQRALDACLEELLRLKTTNLLFRDLLTSMSYRSDLPLLDLILQEQIAVTSFAEERLDWVLDSLGTESRTVEDLALIHLVEEARGSFEEEHPALRDMKMVQAAVKLEHYFLGAYTGVSTWLHQVGRHEAAVVIEEIVDRLGIAERHLEDVRTEVGFGTKDIYVTSKSHRRAGEGEVSGQLEGGYERPVR